MYENMYETLHELNGVSIAVRTLLSMVFGGMLGIERGRKNRPAGFRTYMLVCFGATLVMMTNQYTLRYFHATGDPVRLGAQVVSGIGFLCAGSIMVTGRNQVKGLTTAAGLWASACMGLAIGCGFYMGAIFGGASIFIIMTVMRKFDDVIHARSPLVSMYIEFSKKYTLSEFLIQTRKLHLDVSDIQIIKNKALGHETLSVTMTVKSVDHDDRSRDAILAVVRNIEGVMFLEEV
jgi:putative Mg2+ transporter-C (MgtC) family protein